jgi:hypothetical protein
MTSRFTQDAGGFLHQYDALLQTPTKAQHDAAVAKSGRNYTDDGQHRRNLIGNGTGRA